MEKAVFKVGICILIGNLFTAVVAVKLGIVVAEANGVINAELFKQRDDHIRRNAVVECSGLERYGINKVAGDNNKVGLFGSKHCRNRVESHLVLFNRHYAAADMNIGELNNFEVSVGIKRPVAVGVLFGYKLVFIYNLIERGRNFKVAFVDECGQ